MPAGARGDIGEVYLQVLVLASELIVEVVDEGGVAPPLPPRLARRDGLCWVTGG